MKSLRLLPLLPVLALAGCSSSPSESANSAGSPTGAASNLKVGLITPGDVNDQGWNQLAYEGLQAIEKTGAQVTHQVAKTDSVRPAAIRQMADDDTSLVFLHGGEFKNNALTLAPKYPGTKFVVVAGDAHLEPNVAGLVPKLEDATYLCGMAAAGLTKSKKIGMIGGQDFETVKSAFDAFADGVHAVDKSIAVSVKYVGNWEDQNKGKEIAKNFIASGVDVMIQNADQAGKGMFAAAQESTKAGKPVYVFGSNRNQNDVAPDVTVASAVIDLPKAFVDVAKSVEDKTFKGEVIELNLQNEDITVKWNDALKSKVAAPVMKQIEEASAAIKAGKLETRRK